jgi:hypothetical protein
LTIESWSDSRVDVWQETLWPLDVFWDSVSCRAFSDFQDYRPGAIDKAATYKGIESLRL